MADNSLRTPGSGESVATDELTYSGDTAKVQIVRVVHVSGAEGSKALTEVFDATLSLVDMESGAPRAWADRLPRRASAPGRAPTTRRHRRWR